MNHYNIHSLVIEDDYDNFLGYDPDLSEEKKVKSLNKYKIKEVPLVEGESTNYYDTYTIKVTGKHGFTYTLKKVAPRKFVGEEGIEYSTRTYVE